MHVIVAGIVDLKTNNRDETLRTAEPYIDDARSESGCLAYNWTADPYIKTRIHVFEEWASEQALSEHLLAKSYLDMLAHLGAAGIEEAKTQKFRIEKFEPVYDETGVPRGDFFS